MKLVLPVPPGWSRVQGVEGEIVRSPDGTIELLVLPLGGAKIQPAGWLWAALVHGRPGVEPTNISNGQLMSANGWLAVTVEAALGTEGRFVAYFTFLDLSATVIATCTDRAIPDWRNDVISILYLALPDFAGSGIVGIRELLGAPPPLARAGGERLPPELWRRTSSGGDVVLVPRLEPDAGWIKHSAGLTPLRTVGELFAEFETPPELGITDEGEYFAIATRREDPARALAIVFGAETYTRIEAVMLVPDRFDMFATAVRALAHQAVMGYGVGRLRPYYYEAPADWSPVRRTGSTAWISPRCAREYHVLRVFDACPTEQEAIIRRRRFDTVAPEFLTTPPKGPAVYWKGELEVRVWMYSGTFGGGELRILDATVIDEAYCHPLRVECDASLVQESMQIVEDVVRSIVPLPAFVFEGHEKAQEAFSHWLD